MQLNQEIFEFLCIPAASSYGKDFFVAVPSTFFFGLVSQLIIGTSSNASYSVETAAGVVQTGSVSFNTVHPGINFPKQ